jgi:hypothetical protein
MVEVTVHGGDIVLGVRPVPRGAISRAVRAISDHDSAVQAVRRIEAGIRAGLVLGTWCDTAPEGRRPEDQDWELEQAMAGVVIDPNPLARYREWLESYALGGAEDVAMAYNAVVAASGGPDPDMLLALADVPEEWRRAVAYEAGTIAETSGGAEVTNAPAEGRRRGSRRRAPEVRQ